MQHRPKRNCLACAKIRDVSICLRTIQQGDAEARFTREIWLATPICISSATTLCAKMPLHSAHARLASFVMNVLRERRNLTFPRRTMEFDSSAALWRLRYGRTTGVSVQSVSGAITLRIRRLHKSLLRETRQRFERPKDCLLRMPIPSESLVSFHGRRPGSA